LHPALLTQTGLEPAQKHKQQIRLTKVVQGWCFLLASRYIAARKKVLGPLRVPFFYPNSLGSRGMDWPDYLRDEAAKYRQLAEQTDDPAIKIEMLELASVCEEVANDIEDHLTGG
jgi:hypothetical protein